MKIWLSSADIAGLPGMPKTESAVIRKAKREGYLARWKSGQGGGKEYHKNSLPDKTIAALSVKESANLPAPAIQEIAKVEAAKQDTTTLQQWQRDIMTARIVLYREFQRLKKEIGYTRAVDQLVAMAKNEALPEHLQRFVAQANARKGKTARTLSKSMVKGWQATVRKHGLGGLAPKTVATKKIPAWAPYFLSCYQRPQKPSIPQAIEDMQLLLPPDIKMPSYHQVRRWNNQRSTLDLAKGRNTANAMSKFKGFCRRSTENLLPMDIVQEDGHSLKAYVAHPDHGRPFLPECCMVIDWKTRLCLGWYIGIAESAITVTGALLHSVQTTNGKPGGIPAVLYSDNGGGFKSNHVDDKITGFLARLGTAHETGRPGNAQGRGLIERANHVWFGMAKQFDTYTGKDMDSAAKRKEYLIMDREVKKTGHCTYKNLPTWNELMMAAQRAWDDYNMRPHTSLPKIKCPNTGRVRHLSPIEMWMNYLEKGWEPTTLPQEILDDLERPQVIRKAIRCEVSVFGNTYFAPELVDYNGHKIRAEFDIHDPKEIRVRDMSGRLICAAQFERNKRDAMPVPYIQKKREERATRRLALVQGHKEEIEAELTGTIEMQSNPNIIQIDESVSQRVINQAEQPIIEHNPIPESLIIPTAATADPRQPVVRLNTTYTEDFFDIWNDIQETGRQLTATEATWLNDVFYPTDAGQLQLKMQGDLRETIGIAAMMEGQARP